MDEDFDLSGFHIVSLTPAAVLRDMRVRLGLSQAEIAKKAGIPQQVYQRFESGQRNLMTSSFQTTCRLLEALDIDITKFYHGEYVIGGEIYVDGGGKLRYVESDKLLDEE